MRILLSALVLLWLQLFYSLVATWEHGEYYAYGWFVPFLGAGLAWRRWQILRGPAGPGQAGIPVDGPQAAGRVAVWVVVAAVLAMAVIVPIRMISVADPGWRPPLLLQALLTFGLTHLVIWQAVGRGVSLGLLPVTVFAMSAVPYPWQIEQQLIRLLTGTVVNLTREFFLLAGQPVELLGERLSLGVEAVDVTDGCSGIRSFQSLLMVALFFGELLLLPLSRRLVLLCVAVVCSVVVNTGRAYWLAAIHFSQGHAASAAAHDPLGHVAFAISSAILFAAAVLLLRVTFAGRRVVRRTQVSTLTPQAGE